jgi:hypothetical protein
LSISNAGNRAISIASISGALILFIGTYLHPMNADPNDAFAAFTEYAASHIWVVSHLMQLLGVILITSALILLSRKLTDGPAASLAILGALGATVSLAIAGALQAVDGVALKAMVDKWASSTGSDKVMLFHATYAVRQIEIGLASIASILGGLTFSIYGVASLIDLSYPRWMSFLAMLGGVLTAIAGVVIAYTGFSGLDMAIGMPANVLLLVWMVALGTYSWRAAF